MTESPRPSCKAAAVAAVSMFLLYFATLSPSTWMWDTREYMTAVKVLRLPHPSGNPLFILIANAFARLPLPGSYAQRVNTLAAAASAASAGIWQRDTAGIVTNKILSVAQATRLPTEYIGALSTVR